MTKAQHTPAPWLNDDGLVNGRDSRQRFAGSPSIDIYDYKEWPEELAEEAYANARLIRAAPELLATLEILVSQTMDTIGAIEEFVSMPCDSLRAKLPTTAIRLKKKVEAARLVIADALGSDFIDEDKP